MKINHNMLRNLIELSDRPGGYKAEDFYDNFPNTRETFDHLGQLANSGFVVPRYENEILQGVDITDAGRDFAGRI